MKTNPRKSKLDAASRRSFRPQRILVPVDFSRTSADVLAFAKGYAADAGAQIVLLHVVEPLHVDWKMDTTELQRERQVHSARLLGELVVREFGAGKVAAEIRTGAPVEAITSVARQTKVDLIVIGTHGRTGLKRVLLGSVAERVVRHAPCPVLVVR